MSLNNVSNAVSTNNVTYNATTKPQTAPSQTAPKKEETGNDEKLLLALGGLATIGVATYLITHGKKDKVENTIKDTLPQAAENIAENAGKKADKLKNAAKKGKNTKNAAKKAANKKDAIKDAAKKAAKTETSAPKTAQQAEKAKDAAKKAASKTEDIKNFTGEKIITKKDGTEVTAKFKNGKPTESLFKHPDGTIITKEYSYDPSGKLSTVSSTRIIDGKTYLDETMVFENGNITKCHFLNNKRFDMTYTKDSGTLKYDADVAIFRGNNDSILNGEGVIQYYKDGKVIKAEPFNVLEDFADTIPEEYANIKLKNASKPIQQ